MLHCSFAEKDGSSKYKYLNVCLAEVCNDFAGKRNEACLSMYFCVVCFLSLTWKDGRR
jgi:hypothetical protein